MCNADELELSKTNRALVMVHQLTGILAVRLRPGEVSEITLVVVGCIRTVGIVIFTLL